jgi:hypothetical protein
LRFVYVSHGVARQILTFLAFFFTNWLHIRWYFWARPRQNKTGDTPTDKFQSFFHHCFRLMIWLLIWSLSNSRKSTWSCCTDGWAKAWVNWLINIFFSLQLVKSQWQSKVQKTDIH